VDDAAAPQFEHPLLRRGSLVELMDGPWRIGSPLILSEPAKGTGNRRPVATGRDRHRPRRRGRELVLRVPALRQRDHRRPVRGDDFAIADGWRIAGRAASVPTSAIGGTATTDELMTCGSLFNAAGASLGQRWGVGQDNNLFFAADPTTPTYQVTPGAAALGTADDDYASVVKFRYTDSTTGTFKTVTATNTQTDTRFGRRTYGVNRTGMAAMSSATAQGYANGILALTKGRLAWTNSLTLTSNQIQTMGGVPADLSKVAEDVGSGCMVRLQGIWSDLLEYNGQTSLDIVIGQAQLVDGAQTIQLPRSDWPHVTSPRSSKRSPATRRRRECRPPVPEPGGAVCRLGLADPAAAIQLHRVRRRIPDPAVQADRERGVIPAGWSAASPRPPSPGSPPPILPVGARPLVYGDVRAAHQRRTVPGRRQQRRLHHLPGRGDGRGRLSVA
jgi:hypothetical protein